MSDSDNSGYRLTASLMPIETAGYARTATVGRLASATQFCFWGVPMKLIMVAAVTVGLMTVLALGAAAVYVLVLNASQRSL